MSQPVWVLSVDLQAKTATFQSGMADAARSARSAFKDVGDAAGESSSRTEGGLTNVRAGLGLLDNTIRGNHAAAMADLIREFQHTQIVMAALPLAATAGGILLLAGLIIELAKKVKEWREEQEHLTDEQMKFSTAVDNAYKSLDEKILQAGIRTDELANDHLGALHKQLELIDKQSMSELVQEFGLVAKAADETFGHLQASWYQMGIGSEGAKHALDEFSLRYNALLAQGKDKEASDLLAGTRDSAQHTLAMMDQLSNSRADSTTGKAGNYGQATEAIAALEKAGLLSKIKGDYTKDEYTAQQRLVDALNAQMGIETRVAALKKIDSGNAVTSTGKEAASRQAEAERQAADHRLRMGEMSIAAQREAAAAELSIHEASIQARLASDIALADKESTLQLRHNADEIGALDKGGKDYQNQLKALQDKTLELEQQHADTVAALKDKANVEQYRKELTDLQQSEREKIEATDQGSSERLAAIDAAIREEQAKGLQLTAFYRELLTMRVSVQKAAQNEEDKLRADAGKEAADHIERMGQLSIAAEREHQALQDSARHMTDQLRLQEALKVANEEYAIKDAALKQQMNALDKSGKDYQNRLKALQDKQLELAREHENQMTEIRDSAQMNRNARILQGEEKLQDALASGMARVLMGNQTFATMMASLGDQLATGMIQNALKSMMALDMTKERDAAAAARMGFLAGMKFPFPANIIMAPTLAAANFASMMAYEGGTDMVPGVGRGDVVPAMLSPGEGVVPGGVMDGLRSMARSGRMGGGTTVHVHHSPTYHVQTIDGDGVRAVLTKHNAEFSRHVHGELRKMNRNG